RRVDELDVGRRRAVAVVMERHLPGVPHHRAVLGMPCEPSILVALRDDRVERELDPVRRTDRPAPAILAAFALAEAPHAHDVLHERRHLLEVAPEPVHGLDRRADPDRLLNVDREAPVADTEKPAEIEVRQRAAEQHEARAADDRAARPRAPEPPDRRRRAGETAERASGRRPVLLHERRALAGALPRLTLEPRNPARLGMDFEAVLDVAYAADRADA